MIRTRICLYVLLLTPLLVYWQAIFADYGFRDDYSHLRESREEPGKLVKFTASEGRPLKGALLETSFSLAGEVSNLLWLRLASVLMLTILGYSLWRQLYQSGWTEVEAAVIGLGVTLLPAAQVTAAWAVSWPHVLTLLLALAGFSATETELERGGLKRLVALLGGCLIYALAGLVYQPDALFAVVVIGAVMIVRTGREPMGDVKWSLLHLGTLLTGLAIGYFMVQMLFSNGLFHESPRMHFETNPFTKLGWFLWNPVPNALALYALRDDFNTGAVVFWLVAVAVAGLIGYGYKLEAARNNPVMKKKWLVSLVLLPFLAHAVSLVAGERSTAYRVLFALSGLVIVLVMLALRSVLAGRKVKPAAYYAAVGAVMIVAAVSARHNAFTLIAQPQSEEWDMIRSAMGRMDFKKPTRVYVITPTLADRLTVRVFQDEFGSLSSDSDWAPKEMFKAALHDRFGGKLPAGGSYTFASGREAPKEQDYDLVIDMRKLRERAAQ